MKKSVLIVVVLLLIAAIAGFLIYQNSGNYSSDSNSNENVPSGNEGNINQTYTGNPISYDVEISGFAFNPKEITIKVGDTIKWTNADSASHTATSDSGSELDSNLLSKGQSYSHTFSTAGTFEYHCALHPYMTGKVVVE